MLFVYRELKFDVLKNMAETYLLSEVFNAEKSAWLLVENRR